MATRARKAASGWNRNLVVIVFAACSTASQPHFDKPIAESHTQVEQLVRQAAIPSAAIAVTAGDRIVWLDSFGAPVQSDTQFRVGSVSKVMTAAALMRLADAAKLTLDAPVSTYLPDFPHGEVTLRQLAGHLGGIRHYKGSEFVNREHFDSAAASLARFANDPLVAAPGEKYAYSSYGYNVLGAVIEKVTGKRYDAAMRTLVFEPLGMKDTSLSASTNAASWYVKGNDGTITVAPDVDLSDRWPSGGILSTARDLARFAIGMTRSDFLTRGALDTMFATQKTNGGKETNVGIAWRIAKDGDGRMFVHHGGDAMGARAFILIYPEQRVAVAFVSNLSFAPFSEKDAGEIARRFLIKP